MAVGAPALKDKPAAPDLYGEWEFEAAEHNGKADRGAADGPYRYRFNRDGTWQVFQGGNEAADRRGFKIDPTVDPPALDFNTPPNPRDSPLVPAIYRIEGDRLTICSAFPGKPRPTAFASPPGSEAYLKILRRVKSAK
jgi:uncharacterized protein (TIGR03067 family)